MERASSHPDGTRPARSGGLQRWLRSELPQLLLLLGLMVVARSSLANHYVVPSGSMQHTLEIGDRVAVDMRAYGVRIPFTDVSVFDTGQPAAGDIAVFDSPVDGTRLIKRVVAVAGDRVQLRDGRLSVNGRALGDVDASQAEWFGRHRAELDLDDGGGPDIDGLAVPPGKVLLLGDHRGNSADGRYFGLVDAHALYGRAVAVYYRRGTGFTWQRL